MENNNNQKNKKEMTAQELQTLFHKEKGIESFNSQGEPDIDYVEWLQDKAKHLSEQLAHEKEEVERVKRELTEEDMHYNAMTRVAKNAEKACDIMTTDFFKLKQCADIMAEILEDSRPKSHLDTIDTHTDYTTKKQKILLEYQSLKSK